MVSTIKVLTKANSNFLAFAEGVAEDFSITSRTSTKFVITGANGDVITVEGAGFVFTTINGVPVPVAGTATTMTFSSGGVNKILFSDFSVKVSDIVTALHTDPASIGDLLGDIAFIGNAGNDVAVLAGGNDSLRGGTGADTLIGGNGNDTYAVDNIGDKVSEAGTGGIDAIYSSITFSLSDRAHVLGYVENLALTGTAAINGTGNGLKNALVGNAAANTLKGLGGIDSLNGGGGNDVLIGGADRDGLTGGAGADRFVFNATSESGVTNTTRDVIFDFSRAEGDKIDLRLIDADTTAAGNQAFHFIGTSDFSHHAGELRYVSLVSGAYLYADVNGDGTADFSVRIANVNSVQSGDFFL